MSVWNSLVQAKNNAPTLKWWQYFAIYEKWFSEWKNKSCTFLEIGCFKGGSLKLWRNYFSPLTKIISIDIDKECANTAIPGTFVRIGGQSDTKFLQSIIDEFGVPDIVLDDGSHQQEHITKSFEFLYPLMPKNAIYMVEDLHTAYWQEFGGGGNDSFIEFAKKCTDNLNAEHSRGSIAKNYITEQTLGIHFYDSIIVFEKGDVWIKNQFLSPFVYFDKKIYIFGTGKHAQLMMNTELSNVKIHGFIETSPTKNTFYDLPVFSADTFFSSQKLDDIFVIICSPNYKNEMQETCLGLGLVKGKDFTII
jgi:hypothetical protein